MAMHMLYNSDNFVVVQFDVPSPAIELAGSSAGDAQVGGLSRGGYEIVDKFAQREMFIEGAMAEHFKVGVEALIETRPSEEDMDDYIARYTALMQQPVLLH
jgi:hypothetical protein